MYTTMQYDNKITTDYLVSFCNSHNANESCNVILTTWGVQEHGIKIIFALHTTWFYLLQENGNNEVETAGEEMLCSIIYLENSDKARFPDQKKCVENYYVLDND